jgi:hypothetical protein
VQDSVKWGHAIRRAFRRIRHEERRIVVDWSSGLLAEEIGWAVRRRASATALRTVRRAVTWRPKQQGREPLDIAALISPLRYDVAVRAQFFDFLAAREQDEDAAVVEAARHEPYAVWFREVAMARFRPWVLKDDHLLAEGFRERVLASRALLRSFESRGFDARTPVTLRLTSGATVSDTGVSIRGTVHVGDGGHRLALLLRHELPLEPHMYRLDPRPMPLIDNTVRLLGPLRLAEREYLAFLGRGYGLPAAADRGPEATDDRRDAVPDPLTDPAALLAAVRARNPADAAELEAVLQSHAAARADA